MPVPSVNLPREAVHPSTPSPTRNKGAKAVPGLGTTPRTRPGHGSPRGDVVKVLEKYGKGSCGYLGLPRPLLLGSQRQGAPASPRRRKAEAPRRKPDAAPASCGSSLLASRYAKDLPADTVLTPVGLGTCAAAATTRGAQQAQLQVKFPWGWASFARGCVDASREKVLEAHLRSLSEVFALLVGQLPSVAGFVAEPMDACSVSSEDSEPRLPADVSGVVQGLVLVRTLTAWLEQAVLHPQPQQRDALLDTAVLLSALVRTRTELVKLKGQASTPQLNAERQAAESVRMHLGFLERFITQQQGSPRARPQGLAEKCGQWAVVLDGYAPAQASSRGDDASQSRDEQAAVPGRPLTAWKSVRPGAKLEDERSEQASSQAETRPRTRASTADTTPTALQSQQQAGFRQALPRRIHRSPSPAERSRSGSSVALQTQHAWPAGTASAAPPPSTQVPSGFATYRQTQLCSSMAALGVAAQPLAATGPMGATALATAPVVATAPTAMTTVQVGPPRYPGSLRLPPAGSEPLATAAGPTVARASTPLVLRQSNGHRWVSPPTFLQRAATPVPVRLPRQSSTGPKQHLHVAPPSTQTGPMLFPGGPKAAPPLGHRAPSPAPSPPKAAAFATPAAPRQVDKAVQAEAGENSSVFASERGSAAGADEELPQETDHEVPLVPPRSRPGVVLASQGPTASEGEEEEGREESP